MRLLAASAGLFVLMSACPLVAGDCRQGVEDWFGSTGRYETVQGALTSVEGLPGTAPLDQYERVDQGPNQVDFVHRVGSAEHHRWELVRDDGDWLVWGRSGCIPVGPGGEP